MEVKIEQSWKEALKGEFEKEYFSSLVNFIKEEKMRGFRIFPPGPQIFKAFEMTPLDQVKVVILGQDPYHSLGQAMGLSFSVPDNVPAPASLRNIFKEIEDDLNVKMSGKPNLESWAKQGVLLLNAILTVREAQASSHSNKGWEQFTDAVIAYLSENKSGIVFLLWGAFARSKKNLIDESKHQVLEAAHPSPLARGAFFGCKHFSKTNEILLKQGVKPIDWIL